MATRVKIDQALFAGPSERCAVSDGCAEIGIPGVEVCVEVHDRERSVLLEYTAKQWQCHSMVTAKHHEPSSRCPQGVGLSFYLFDGLINRKWIDR